jgi:hydrogenase maturation protease
VSERRAGSRVLIAGIGNVFLADDGFGVAVVERIDRGQLPGEVDVVDYGIRGVHLAYDLRAGEYHTLVLIDALPLQAAPGTVAVLEIGRDDVPAAPTTNDAYDGAVADAHGMHPQAALRLLRGLGGELPRVLVVGCQPASVEEAMGLSPAVAAAVDEAVRLATQLASDAVCAHGRTAIAPVGG